MRVVLHLVNHSENPMCRFVAAVKEATDDVLAGYNDLDEEWQAGGWDEECRARVVRRSKNLQMMSAN